MRNCIKEINQSIKALLSIRAFRVFITAFSIIVFFISFTSFKGVTASNEMYPTFNKGEKLIAMRSNSYTYGDIVTYKSPLDTSDAYIIRRVIGLPGDTIYFHDGTLYINGAATDEEYVYYDPSKEGYVEGIIYTLEDNQYFLAGDNRNYSVDSRVCGGIVSDDIFGKIVFSTSRFFNFR
ncbi:signal peptidase I [Pseudobutyrivibrio sp. AR14]|uniref:signal peptidase I n=1 Tax=Pseudobutyrivibrio sp. AR14 TaxID=1520804 RepID=UPI0008885239|nr:signal peptidase I [Pseudobutyrivibrio sp. AR14]SCX95940.1 signal peptidase I [Pseudobutyrivibrio sp. AR14]